jgi:hypothetical protein
LSPCSIFVPIWEDFIFTEHDQVGRVSVHVLGIEAAVKQLGVATPAVNVLLVLDRELDDQGLFAVGEGLELGRHGVELGILGVNIIKPFCFPPSKENKCVFFSSKTEIC